MTSEDKPEMFVGCIMVVTLGHCKRLVSR